MYAHIYQKLVHARALDLMGVTRGQSNNRLQAIVLPSPLGIREQHRTAQNGTRLWNPDWRQDSMFPMNAAFLDAIADLILDQEKVSRNVS
jgi:hypothetical protein